MTGICCENNLQIMYQGIRLSTFVNWLEESFEKYNIYHPDERNKQAWLAILKELTIKAIECFTKYGDIIF